MKQILLIILISTFAFSGFYDSADEADSKKAEYEENERLCKIFTAKVEKYKIDMRDDVLAVASLASYEQRAELFCKKAEEAKKLL
jgi:hypothetical protein